jgi:hypothetical protein
LNWGADIGFWKTTKDTSFFAVAIYPMFRFTLLRSKPLDGYLQYSVAGPAFVSKRFIDGFDTGRRFTFQDLMGMGFLTGEKKNISIEFMLGHYSNGNIFPKNAGIKLPLQVNLGYSFYDLFSITFICKKNAGKLYLPIFLIISIMLNRNRQKTAWREVIKKPDLLTRL